MNKSKGDLADLVLMLMDMHGVEAAPLRICEQVLTVTKLEHYDGSVGEAAQLCLIQEFPPSLAGKRCRVVIGLVEDDK
jgi:hypothetical protein